MRAVMSSARSFFDTSDRLRASAARMFASTIAHARL